MDNQSHNPWSVEPRLESALSDFSVMLAYSLRAGRNMLAEH